MAPTSLGLHADATVGDVAPAPVSPLTRVRVLTVAAFGALITGYAAVAALLALITAVAPLAHFSTDGVLRAALPGWLAAHQVPIAFDGLELGFLPLLPTIGVVVVAIRAAAGAAERLGLARPWQAGQVVAAIAVAHGAFGLIIALLPAGEAVSVDPLAAFYYPALIATLAAIAGVFRRCGLREAFTARADEVAVRGLHAGAVAVLALLAIGAAVLTAALLASVPTARELFGSFAPGAGNGLGMLLLSVGFLPNAVVAATGFVAGPGFSMGVVTVSPVDFGGGPVPGLPLLAALPEKAAAWWPALCLLPLVVGVLVGRRLRNVAEEPLSRMRGVAVAAGVVALVFVVLAGSAGGRVGAGAFDPVNLRAAATSVALALWIAVPAAVTAWFGGPRRIREAPPAPGTAASGPPESSVPANPDKKDDGDADPVDRHANDDIGDDHDGREG